MKTVLAVLLIGLAVLLSACGIGSDNDYPSPVQVCRVHKSIQQVSVDRYGYVAYVVCKDGYGTDQVD